MGLKQKPPVMGVFVWRRGVLKKYLAMIPHYGIALYSITPNNHSILIYTGLFPMKGIESHETEDGDEEEDGFHILVACPIVQQENWRHGYHSKRP